MLPDLWGKLNETTYGKSQARGSWLVSYIPFFPGGLKWCKNTHPDLDLADLRKQSEIIISTPNSSQTVEQGKVFHALKKRLFTNNDGLSAHMWL